MTPNDLQTIAQYEHRIHTFNLRIMIFTLNIGEHNRNIEIVTYKLLLGGYYETKTTEIYSQ